MNTNWDAIPNDDIIQKTVSALIANGIDAEVFDSKEEARERALSLVPEQSEVMTMTSVTTKEIGLDAVVNVSGKYKAVRKIFETLDRNTQKQEMKKYGSAPAYAIGSVHAVTHDGKVLIASNTGSQTAAYVYGAGKVIWLVGVNKIVPTVEAGSERIYEHILPLESARLNKQYNITSGSYVSKFLIINREIEAHRIHLLFIKENLGF